MYRYFITGTDTDVGKTIVCAALACALEEAGRKPTIVKLVQTGLTPSQEGDAQRAERLSGVRARECARYALPADPWSAALDAGCEAPRVAELATSLASIAGSLVVEGAGGLLVPLNESESLADLARAADLEVLVVVGLKLGCINHARLTLEAAERRGLRMAGVLLCQRYGGVPERYLEHVTRALQGNVAILGNLPFASAESASVAAGARLLAPLAR